MAHLNTKYLSNVSGVSYDRLERAIRVRELKQLTVEELKAVILAINARYGHQKLSSKGNKRDLIERVAEELFLAQPQQQSAAQELQEQTNARSVDALVHQVTATLQTAKRHRQALSETYKAAPAPAAAATEAHVQKKAKAAVKKAAVKKATKPTLVPVAPAPALGPVSTTSSATDTPATTTYTPLAAAAALAAALSTTPLGLAGVPTASAAKSNTASAASPSAAQAKSPQGTPLGKRGKRPIPLQDASQHSESQRNTKQAPGSSLAASASSTDIREGDLADAVDSVFFGVMNETGRPDHQAAGRALFRAAVQSKPSNAHQAPLHRRARKTGPTAFKSPDVGRSPLASSSPDDVRTPPTSEAKPRHVRSAGSPCFAARKAGPTAFESPEPSKSDSDQSQDENERTSTAAAEAAETAAGGRLQEVPTGWPERHRMAYLELTTNNVPHERACELVELTDGNFDDAIMLHLANETPATSSYDADGPMSEQEAMDFDRAVELSERERDEAERRQAEQRRQLLSAGKILDSDLVAQSVLLHADHGSKAMRSLVALFDRLDGEDTQSGGSRSSLPTMSTHLSDLRGTCVQLLKLEKAANKSYGGYARAWFTSFARELDEFTPAHIREIEDRLFSVSESEVPGVLISDLIPGEAASGDLCQLLKTKYEELTQPVFLQPRPFPPEMFVQAYEQIHGAGPSLDEDGIEIVH